MRLLIRADASAAMGSGHVMRCLALAQAWQAAGGSVAFLSHCESDAVRARIEQAGVQLIGIERPHPDPSDLQATLERAATASWTALDGYHFDSSYQRALRADGHRLMVIDDTAHLENYHADVLLNQNINAEELSYRCDAETRLLLGTRYALLRREFLEWRELQRKTPEAARKVLATMGGGDPDNVTAKVIRALFETRIDQLEAVIVIGGNNPHYEKLQALIAEREGQTAMRLVRNAANMPELMAWADVAVTASGSTAWETALMKLPALLIVVADNQAGIARGLHECGVSQNLGWHERLSARQIADALEELSKEFVRRQEMSERGRATVDGLGGDRVVSILQAQC